MAQRGRSRFDAQREGALGTDGVGGGGGLSEAVPPSWQDLCHTVRPALMYFWMFQNRADPMSGSCTTVEKLSSLPLELLLSQNRDNENNRKSTKQAHQDNGNDVLSALHLPP